METSWLSYFFIDYSDFLLANYLYSSPWKNPSCFFDFGPFWRPKAQSFRISEQHPNFQFSRVMLTSLGYVADVVLSNIKKDCWGKFEPVSTYEEITEKDW